MATYAQTPGLLNIKAVTGTDFSCQLDFDTSLVGYTFDSAIVLQEYPTKREQAITVTVDNAAQGIITLSLTDAQTSALGTFSKKKWYLNWNISGIKQTILAGNFELSDIPLGQNEVTSTGITINTQSVDITLSAFSNAALDGKQPLNAALTQISNLSPNNDDFIQRKSGAWVTRSIPQVKTDLGISNVDNTSDANKPLSTAAVNALSYKVNTNQISAFGYALIDDTTSAAARTTLELGDMAQQSANNVNITGGNAVLSNPLGLASGGTNSSLTGVNGGIVYSTPSSLAVSAAGTSGQFLRSNGTGAPSWESPSATATTTTVFDNTTANREFFPVFAYQSAGAATTLYGSSTKLKFNPSNGYFTAEGGLIVGAGAVQFDSNGISSSGQIILDVNIPAINDPNGEEVANWGGGNGMYVAGTASKDVPLRLVDDTAGNLATGSYIIVRPSSSATTNGTELRNAYAAAKTFTPNTLALSATNRATVLLLPGRYDLGITPLTMDTEFVDLVGISEEPRHVFITSQVILSDSGTIVQTADNVTIRNVSIDRTGAPAGSGAGRTAAYLPNRTSTTIQSWTSNGTLATVASNGHGLQNGDSVRITGSGNTSFDGTYTITRIDDNSFSFASTVNSSGLIGTATERFDDTYIENCRFSGDSSSGMRQAVEYAGTYRRCVGGNFSFGGGLGNASGLFEDCTAGTQSFGGSTGNGSIASGTFRRCSAGELSFGFFVASGTFENCTATAVGSFGANGTASGTFTDCLLTSAGSFTGTFTGTMRRCRFVTTGTNANALRVGAGAKIFDSTLIATGTGNSITAGSAVTISLAGCRMNKDINANVFNNLGTLTESYNLIDADID
jgi:hypothetical protein